jgi:hypothetical protein
MSANRHQTYEDAAKDYLTKLRALMDPPPDSGGTVATGSGGVPADVLIGRAEEIAGISTGMIQLAQGYLESADPVIREGIRGHFIDQATAELMLGIELLQIAEEEQTGRPSTAATRATSSAALWESISAVEKSSSVPVSDGISVGTSYRATDAATVGEAASAVKQAVDASASSISHRVQELGGDIAFDLVIGTQWTEVIQGAALFNKDIARLLESVKVGAGALFSKAVTAAARTLLNVYEKVVALLGKDVETAARGKIREWLDQIKQANKIELFASLIETLYGMDAIIKSVERELKQPNASLEILNRTADAVKALSDKFIVLVGRIRKLEDAMRLGKLIRIPQVLLVIVALQLALLAAVVYEGHAYLAKGLTGILRDNLGIQI